MVALLDFYPKMKGKVGQQIAYFGFKCALSSKFYARIIFLFLENTKKLRKKVFHFTKVWFFKKKYKIS
jgi:hypothetical protein